MAKHDASGDSANDPRQQRRKSPRRSAAQQLSSLRNAGVRQVIRRATKPASRSASVPAPAISPQPTPQPPAQPLIADAKQIKPLRESTPHCASPASLFEAPRSTLPQAEREEKLRLLAQRVAQCERCAELAQTRTQTVFGVGNPQARILFIGEAPGAEEDRQGEPFVGAAGQLLNRILEASKLKRSDVYICNILRCRPPGNRTPHPQEAANCHEWLEGQLELVDPDYIVCLGSVAARYLLESMESIGKLRGRFFQYGRAKVVCTYHPAYLLRNPAAKKEVWLDMKFLMRDLGVDLDAK